jgi:hypothetical protein
VDNTNQIGTQNCTTPTTPADTTKEPCKQKLHIDSLVKNAIISAQNALISKESTTIEYGANENLSSLTGNTYLNTSVTPGTTDSWTPTFSWDDATGFSIGSSHYHPAGDGPSPDDVFTMIANLTNTNNVATQNLINSGASVIQFYRNNVSITVLTQTEDYVVTVNNWGTLSMLYAQYQASLNTGTNIYGFDTDFSTLAGEYAATNNLSSAAGNIFALLSTFGNAINVYEAPHGSTAYQPLAIASNLAVGTTPCPQ